MRQKTAGTAEKQTGEVCNECERNARHAQDLIDTEGSGPVNHH